MEQNPHGDKDFDPEHNKRVIKETIKKTDEMIRRKGREHDDAYRERAHAGAKYLKAVSEGTKTTDINKYFGNRYLAYLRGMEVMNKLKANATMLTKAKLKTKGAQAF